jgi:hypothetical protein
MTVYKITDDAQVEVKFYPPYITLNFKTWLNIRIIFGLLGAKSKWVQKIVLPRGLHRAKIWRLSNGQGFALCDRFVAFERWSRVKWS